MYGNKQKIKQLLETLSLSPLLNKRNGFSLMRSAAPLKLLRKQFIYSSVYVITNRDCFRQR